MNNKLKPALLGGLIVGLLSAIPFINYCCCIWAIGGGLLAGMLYIKESPTQVPTGDGAIVGALAGVVGGLIYLIIGLPIAFLFGAAQMEEQLGRSGVHLAHWKDLTTKPPFGPAYIGSPAAAPKSHPS